MDDADGKTKNEGPSDADHPDNQKLKAPEGFDGPGSKRRPTDVLCLLLIIASWCAMTGIGLVVTGAIQDDSLKTGNPARLINGMDYMANICGVSEKKCGAGDLETDGGSVKSSDDCKQKHEGRETYAIEKRSKAYPLPDGSFVCLKSCPKSDNYNNFICQYDVMSTLSEVDASTYTTSGWEYVSKGVCSPQVKTDDFANYCVPKAATQVIQDASNEAARDVNPTFNMTKLRAEDNKTMFEMFQADLMTASGYIFGYGIGITALVGFIYLRLLRVTGVLFIIVWGLVALIFLCLFLPGMMLVQVTAKEWREDDVHSDAQASAIESVGYVFLALSALYACFICFMRHRIMLALGITKEAARSMAAMPIVILLPILQCMGVCVFLVPWVFYSLFLASSGDVQVNTYEVNGQEMSYREFVYTDNMRYAGLYLLFVWFWTTQFIVALGQIIIAMCVASWYFARDKKTVGNLTVFSSIKRTLIYHSGTAAFGSLLIAIIKTIRAIVMYLQKKAKKSKSKIAMAVLCCIQCCLWCIEKCMKFMNKNAYIQTAIFGYSFCKASRCAFFLILRNIARILAVSMVSEIVGLLGKLLVPAATLLLTYLSLQYSGVQLYSFWSPLLFTFILSYMVTDVFIEIFQMAISTILQCFVADEEMFDPEHRFADGSLKSCISNTKKAKNGCACLPCFGSSYSTKVVPVQQKPDSGEGDSELP